MFRSKLPHKLERFVHAREDFLMSYCYNTARAYWGDLDDIYGWSNHRGFDALDLSTRQLREYGALMRRRRYSENTIRRRMTAYSSFIRWVKSNGLIAMQQEFGISQVILVLLAQARTVRYCHPIGKSGTH